MAVAPADLLAPAGPVEEELFPGEGNGTAGTELYGRLSEYITRAQEKAAGIAFPDPDAAVESWALHLTFEAAYLLSVARPANENTMVEVLGSQGFARDQRDALRSMADYYARSYHGYVAEVPTEAQPLGAQTRQITNSYEW